ncbi:MAG: diacylglycerol kinase [Planctomycetaceae bacterium]|nr:diacylglycerol kinase [Planctomycetaceae bacterium]
MPRRSWFEKFADAFRGIGAGMRGQGSFRVHLGMAVAVVALARILRVNLVEWCLLILCIAAVLAAELFNSAIERLAREVDREHNPNVGAALDIASGAVLLAALGAAIVGCLIFGHRTGAILEWWP